MLTASGTPIIDMWGVVMPVPDSSHIPLLHASHHLVWQPADVTDGGYNHYACLIRFKSKFFAMWSNHQLGEDAPGQRVLFSIGDDWNAWGKANELFAPPGPIKPRHEKGIHLKSDRWVVVNDELYAVVFVHGAGRRYPIARKVHENGTSGIPFLLDPLPKNAQLPQGMDSIIPPVANAIKNWYRINDQISWWADEDEGISRKGIDGANLIETFMYRAKNDTLVTMLRNWGTNSNPVHNNRLYVSFSKDGNSWTIPQPTNIPDAPTRAQALRLPNGKVLLMGTQYVREFDKPFYLDRDPLTVSVSDDGLFFDKIYAIRTGAPKKWRIPNVGGRNPGFAYSSSIIENGYLYTFYSVGKEEMAISRVLLNEIDKDDDK